MENKNVKYILNRTKFLKEGGLNPLSPTIHDTLEKAQAKFHRNIGTDMDDETLSGSVSVITDTEGMRHDNYVWGEIIEA